MTAGQTPSEAVRACRLFPEMFANLYASGEISGKLDESLRHLTPALQRGRHAQAPCLRTNGCHAIIYLLVVLFIAYIMIQFYTGLMVHISDLSNILNGF